MTTPAGKPTKTMSMEDFYVKTDNANKLMRVWYCIAATEKDIGDQAIFWEHWYWNNEAEESKPLDGKNAKEASNHTLTITAENEKTVDYPLWPVTFTRDKFKMYPAINLGCTTIAPIGMALTPIAFPTNDSRSEFRVDYIEMFGKSLYFIFVLDPKISEDDKKKEFDKLEAECGVKKEWFHFVQWDEKYEIGSSGEPDINPK